MRVLLRIAGMEEEDSGVRGKTLCALLDIVLRHAYNQSAAGAEGAQVLLRIADSERVESCVRKGALCALRDIVARHVDNQSAAGAEGAQVLLRIADSENVEFGVREQALTAFFMVLMVTRRIKSWLLMVQCLLLIVF